MKKLLVALPFVATASWAGTTLYSGSQTRAAHEDLVAELDRTTTLSVSAESYTSGFAASSAVTQVRLTDAPGGDVLFRLRHEIAHSPVGFEDGRARVGAAHIVTTLLADGLGDDVRDVLASFEGGEPFVLESNVGFGGAVAHALRVPAFERDGGGGGTLRFDGAEYLIEADTAGHLIGTGTLGKAVLELPDAGTRITVAPGADRFELDWLREGVFTGEQHLAFGTVSLEAQGMKVRLEKVRLDSSSAKDGERLDSQARLSVGHIEAPIPLPLRSASIGVRAGGVDLAGLDAFLDRIDALKLLAAGNATPEQLLAEVGGLYADVVRPGFSLDYDVAFANAGGDVAASAGLLFEGDGSASGHDSTTTVGELLRALKLSARLDADADAVAMTPAAMFLTGDRLAPWILSDADGYRSAIVVDDLMVDVNGEPLSLEAMLGETLALPLDLSMLADLPRPGTSPGR